MSKSENSDYQNVRKSSLDGGKSGSDVQRPFVHINYLIFVKSIKSMTKKFVVHELLGKHLGGPLYGANRQILVEVTVFQCFWETGSTSGNDRKLKTSPLNLPYTN